MQTPVVITVKILLDVLSIIFILLRLYATHHTPRTAATLTTHAFLGLCLGFSLGATAALLYITSQRSLAIKKYGDNDLLVNMTISNHTRAFFSAHLCYFFALYSLKFAFLGYYTQLFSRAQTRRRFLLYAGMATTGACWLTGLGVIFGRCWPVKDNWNPLTRNKNCPTVLNFTGFSILASLNIFSDISILLAPLSVVTTLHLSTREWIGLVSIFLTGGSSILASIVRFVILGRRLHNQMTWETVHIFAIVSHAEVFFGIIAFCLPAYRVLIRRIVERRALKHTTSSSTNHRSAGGGGGGGGWKGKGAATMDEEGEEAPIAIPPGPGEVRVEKTVEVKMEMLRPSPGRRWSGDTGTDEWERAVSPVSGWETAERRQPGRSYF